MHCHHSTKSHNERPACITIRTITELNDGAVRLFENDDTEFDANELSVSNSIDESAHSFFGADLVYHL